MTTKQLTGAQTVITLEQAEKVLQEKFGGALRSGGHEPDGQVCAMEFASYLAGEKWGADPKCVSPVISTFMVRWNDSLSTDADRNRLLLPLIPLTIGTRTNAKDENTRAWLCADWSIRVSTVEWLRLAKLDEHADALAALPEINSTKRAKDAMSVIESARAAAGAAARAAAGAAAWDAARAAAWDAAGAAAWAAAGDAARAAAGAAAGDAAWDAARAAAWAAAGEGLAPVVARLQESAQDLVRRMCDVGRNQETAAA